MYVLYICRSLIIVAVDENGTNHPHNNNNDNDNNNSYQSMSYSGFAPPLKTIGENHMALFLQSARSEACGGRRAACAAGAHAAPHAVLEDGRGGAVGVDGGHGQASQAGGQGGRAQGRGGPAQGDEEAGWTGEIRDLDKFLRKNS